MSCGSSIGILTRRISFRVINLLNPFVSSELQAALCFGYVTPVSHPTPSGTRILSGSM